MKKILCSIIMFCALIATSFALPVYADGVITPTIDCTLSFDQEVYSYSYCRRDNSAGNAGPSTTGPYIGVTPWLNLTNVDTLSFTYTIKTTRYEQWSDSSASGSARLKLQILKEDGTEVFSKDFTSTADKLTYLLDVSELYSAGYDLSKVQIKGTPSTSASASNNASASGTAKIEQTIECKVRGNTIYVCPEGYSRASFTTAGDGTHGKANSNGYLACGSYNNTSNYASGSYRVFEFEKSSKPFNIDDVETIQMYGVKGYYHSRVHLWNMTTGEKEATLAIGEEGFTPIINVSSLRGKYTLQWECQSNNSGEAYTSYFAPALLTLKETPLFNSK